MLQIDIITEKNVSNLCMCINHLVNISNIFWVIFLLYIMHQ